MKKYTPQKVTTIALDNKQALLSTCSTTDPIYFKGTTKCYYKWADGPANISCSTGIKGQSTNWISAVDTSTEAMPS